MKQDEIIEMARQAEFFINDKLTITSPFIEDICISPMLTEFAKLVAAKEREACAKVCDEREQDFMGLFHKYGYEEDSGAMLASMQCAKAIRARGEA